MRGKQRCAVWITAALAALAAGCDSVISQKVFFKELEHKVKEPLLPAQRKPNCKLDIDLDYAVAPQEAARKINAEIVRLAFDYEGLSPQAAVDSFVSSYLRNYKEELTPIYEAEQKNNAVTPEWYDYSYSIDGKEKEGKTGYVCYQIEIERNEGGTESLCSTYSMTFDAQTGERIQLKDVFAPGSEEALNRILLQALLDEMNCATLAELQETGILLLTDMYATENFRLGRRAVKFVYSPSEIAPSEVGEIELTIPYFDLHDLLKKDK